MAEKRHYDHRTRRDRTTAAIALAILIVLAGYHLWDTRAAFSDFDGWWAYFKPMYAGDDYIRVTELAERQGDWHDRYRAIALGVAIRREAPTVETIYEPEDLWLLWGESEEAPRSWEHPGVKDDYFGTTIARAERVPKLYDPVLSAETIQEWEDRGIVEHVGWNIAYLKGYETEATVVLHCDAPRSTIYIVPLSLAPSREATQ